MAGLTNDKLRASIAEILKGADLNSLSSKKVRLMLEEKHDIDLSDRKKEVDTLVMDMISASQGEGTGDAANGASDQSDMSASTGKTAGKGGGRKGKSAYSKKCILSPELADVVGANEMARHEVVKKMWQIVKERNLADPENRQFAVCDDQLLKVFGVKRFRTFGMMKFLKNHIKDAR